MTPGITSSVSSVAQSGGAVRVDHHGAAVGAFDKAAAIMQPAIIGAYMTPSDKQEHIIIGDL